MKTFNTCLISQRACTRCSRSRVPKAISTFTYDLTTINEFLQVRIRISQSYENIKNLSFLLQNRKQRKAYAINQNHGVIFETYKKRKRYLRQISMEVVNLANIILHSLVLGRTGTRKWESNNGNYFTSPYSGNVNTWHGMHWVCKVWVGLWAYLGCRMGKEYCA